MMITIISTIAIWNLSNAEVQFAGLAAPLSFEAKTVGALEASLAALLNNGVALFNKVGGL